MEPRLRAVLVIFWILFSSKVMSTPLECDGPSIHKFEIPLDFKNPLLGHWTYRIQIIPGKDLKLPTVIRLPGGPGQSGIKTTPSPLDFQAPWTVINVDPRGAGCNTGDQLDLSDTFRTEQLARDVLEVVRQLKLKSYVVHGASYGTVWATVLSHLAQDFEIPLPNQVILEATLGRYFNPGEYFKEFELQWENLKPGIPLEHFAALIKDPLPFGLDSAQWGRVIMTALVLGDSPISGNPLTGLILPNIKSENKAVQMVVTGIVNSWAKDDSDMNGILHQKIFCRELASSYLATTIRLIGGRLVNSEPTDLCENIAIEKLYESDHWQIPVPIVYIQGQADPATPLWHAKLHFAGQKSAPKTFIEVPGAGHNPLNLGLEDCAEDLMISILKGVDLAPSLASCAATPLMTTN